MQRSSELIFSEERFAVLCLIETKRANKCLFNTVKLYKQIFATNL